MAVMWTWFVGIRHLRKTYSQKEISFEALVEDLQTQNIPRIQGTAVFLADTRDPSAGGLLHHLKINQILHQKVIVLNVMVEPRPYLSLQEVCSTVEAAPGIYRISLRFGFMQNIHVPHTLEIAHQRQQLPFFKRRRIAQLGLFR